MKLVAFNLLTEYRETYFAYVIGLLKDVMNTERIV